MHDGGIDYSAYTLRELEEALAGIDRQQYPRNYANLQAAYCALKPQAETAPEKAPPVDDNVVVEKVVDDSDAWKPKYDEQGRYIPNMVPLRELVSSSVMAIFIIGYGVHGALGNDVYIPRKRGPGTHFHDEAMWLVVIAMALAAASLLLRVVDHFDRRDNQHRYRIATLALTYLAMTMFFAAFFVNR